MGTEHKEKAQERIGTVCPPMKLLGEYHIDKAQPFEIDDPKNEAIEAFRECLRIMEQCLSAFLDDYVASKLRK